MLLYIGITLDPTRRFKEHRKDQGWWPAVARRDVEWLQCGGWAALEVEQAAIGAEQPLCNGGFPRELPPGCPPRPESWAWFDRAAQFRDWLGWFAVWRDCQLNREEREALGR